MILIEPNTASMNLDRKIYEFLHYSEFWKKLT